MNHEISSSEDIFHWPSLTGGNFFYRLTKSKVGCLDILIMKSGDFANPQKNILLYSAFQ